MQPMSEAVHANGRNVEKERDRTERSMQRMVTAGRGIAYNREQNRIVFFDPHPEFHPLLEGKP
jgi:hypothetical protein